MHRDPPGTLAWNALLKGCKIRALPDPKMTPHEARCGDEFWHSDLPSASWFKDHLPEVVKHCPEGMIVQFAVQHPGDVLVIPPNWWHAIWNIEDTIAVTENGVSKKTFCDEVFGGAKGGESKCDESFAARLDTEDEDLVARVEAVFGLENRDAAAQWMKEMHTAAVFCILNFIFYFLFFFFSSTLHTHLHTPSAFAARPRATPSTQTAFLYNYSLLSQTLRLLFHRARRPHPP